MRVIKAFSGTHDAVKREIDSWNSRGFYTVVDVQVTSAPQSDMGQGAGITYSASHYRPEFLVVITYERADVEDA